MDASAFPTASLLELFCNIQIKIQAKEALCAKKSGLFGTLSLRPVNKRVISESIALYKSTTRFLQNYLVEDGARLWDVKRRAQLGVWLGLVTVLLNSDGSLDD